MTSIKDKAIKKIINEFEKLSNLTLEQLDLLKNMFEVKSGESYDDLLKKINKNEELIDKYEVNLDNQIIKTIVLYKPVASDLRQIFAVYRMVINLERIGDLVIKVANHNIKVKDSEFFKNSLPMLQHMLQVTSDMVRKSLTSFIDNDKEPALWTIKKDNEIDKLNRKLLKKSIKNSDLEKEFQSLILNLSDIGTIISSIERIADQATNIAEASIYSLIGAIVRHQDIEDKDI